MKNYPNLILLALFLLVLEAQGQQWCAFNSNRIYNYSLGTGDSLNFDVSIRCDSSKSVHGDSVFFLNTFSIYDSDNFILNQSHFLQRQIISSGNTFRFRGPGDFILRPASKLNDSWIFDSSANSIATVVQALPYLIFGVADSVKVILLSTQDTIRISKNFGIIQFPGLDSGENYHLIGIDNVNLGRTVPKVNDFFNYTVDDSFEYKSFKGIWTTNPHNHAEEWQHYRYRITNIKKEPDRIVYWRKGNGYFYESLYHSTTGEPYSFGPDFYIDDSVTIKQDEYAFLDAFNKELTRNDSGIHTLTTIYYAQKYSDIQKDCYSTPVSAILTDTITPSFFGAHTWRSFVNNIGLVSENSTTIRGDMTTITYACDLIAYRGQNNRYGQFSADSLFNNTDQAPVKPYTFTAFPNPAHEKIQIHVSEGNIDRITLFDRMGKCIFDETCHSNTMEIDIRSFQPGVYLIHCTQKNSASVLKFIRL